MPHIPAEAMVQKLPRCFIGRIELNKCFPEFESVNADF